MNELSMPTVDPSVVDPRHDADMISTDNYGIFNGTGIINGQELESYKKLIIDSLNTKVKFSLADGYDLSDLHGLTIPSKYNFPILVVINGIGAVGKDTFIDTVNRSGVSVMAIDSVKPVKDACDVLIRASVEAAAKTDEMYGKKVMNARETKQVPYRELLHAIKMGWANMYDGPTKYMVDTTDTILTEQINGGNAYDLIFYHIREPEEIAKFVKEMRERGLITLTMMIHGWDRNDSKYDPNEDKIIESMQYDINITNRYGDIETFRDQARHFAKVIQVLINNHTKPDTSLSDTTSDVQVNDQDTHTENFRTDSGYSSDVGFI